MTDELRSKIQNFADDYGVSVNSAINMAIEEFIREGKIERIEKEIEDIKARLQEIEKDRS